MLFVKPNVLLFFVVFGFGYWIFNFSVVSVFLKMKSRFPFRFWQNNWNSQGITSWFLWRSAYLTRLGSWRLRLQVPLDWLKTLMFGRDTSRFEWFRVFFWRHFLYPVIPCCCCFVVCLVYNTLLFYIIVVFLSFCDDCVCCLLLNNLIRSKENRRI